MPKPKKDRTAEIQAVFDNLKYCPYDDLKAISEKVASLMKKKEDEAIEKKKEEIARLQEEIENIERNRRIIIADKEGKVIETQDENGNWVKKEVVEQ